MFLYRIWSELSRTSPEHVKIFCFAVEVYIVITYYSPGDHVPYGGIFTPFEPKRRIAKDEVLRGVISSERRNKGSVQISYYLLLRPTYSEHVVHLWRAPFKPNFFRTSICIFC